MQQLLKEGGNRNPKQNQFEWRSITPEREFGQMLQGKPLITEPNENKQTAKSMSQENNMNNQDFQSKHTNLNKLLIPDSQQQKFQRPLNYMQTSLKKMSEIGQQINSILQKFKQNRIHRPQSDLNMFDKHSMMKKTSQNDISLSTNLNLNHSYIDIRGTETERSYFQYKNHKDNGKQLNKDSKDYQFLFQNSNNQFQTNSLKKIIEKKIAQAMQTNTNNMLYNDYKKQINKESKQERSYNIQKYITNKFLRNSSCLQANEKSDRKNKQMSSYFSQNHYSKSQSSFLIERENSKSENTTSRNNRIRVSSYIKTPTKNNSDLIKQFSPRFISQQLSSYQVSSSKINSLLSSMNKDIEKIKTYNNIQNLNIYHIQAIPLFLSNDPNQTHVIVGCSDLSVRAINLYSGRIQVLGKHQRPIKSITKVVIQHNFKTFYSCSLDNQVIQWVSESMHGTYRLKHSWRMDEVPLQLYQTEKGVLYIVTANYIFYFSSVTKKQIKYHGVFNCMIQTSSNIFVAIDNFIYKLQADSLQLVCTSKKPIKNMIYEEGLLYVLQRDGALLIYEEAKHLKFNSEIDIGAMNIFTMQNGQIIIQTNDSEFIVYSQQISKSYQIDGKIKCLLALQQMLLIGSNKKLIETLKF
ncbi:unnamed protein product (macronuclear) [Paramecium tetraurelia]|uniref:Uncharacterized protein n=1 Tax=Paramecium tetraurelia TaxID=5888 RepID=A0DU41_PARTE|nr:uncharacterized protein GSPATT00020229001 [Paramecium tetraurelia]CAK86558.1 unnamed protein product [Paramecium tetraurelia]|eukprot:XP_001453955.1 hypothetical protein (macronuclear) [Paramecium tetraurelia strain d4-2]